jgi:hypothetical protein
LKKILFLFVILFTSVNAQTYLDSLSFFNTPGRLNLLQTRFEKQLSTYYLNSAIEYSEQFNRVSIGLHENYHSTFIKSSLDKNIRDEHSFLLNTGYHVDTLLDLTLSLSNIILSDNRKIEINQASVSNAVLLTKITPLNRVSISPFAGYSNNRQKLENDYGAVYGIGGVMDRLTFTDLTVSSEFLFRNEDISPRKNYNRYLNINALNSFSSSVENNLNFRYSESRKDFYYDADSVTALRFNIKNNIQSRTESNYLLQNYLFYSQFLDMFILDVTGRVNWRTIDRSTRYKIFSTGNTVFDTDINELRMEVESGLTYYSSVHRTSLRLIINQRDEKHLVEFNPEVSSIINEQRSEQEKRKNNTSVRASISLNSDINVSRKDKISLSFLQNKLRYDTPSSENYDDRDEVLSIARVRYSRMLHPFFEFFTALEGTYSHTVYIFSEQSSNNSVNRILKFNSGGIYKGKNFSSNNTFEVSANYTIYDFEDINPNYRSFSFRQFTASDSTFIRLNGRLGLFIGGYVKLSEQGDLKWKSFSTRPNRYLEELYAEPKIIYNTSAIAFGAGMRLFSLKTFRYNNNVKEISTRYTSTGPVMEIQLLLNNTLSTRLFGWYEFIRLEDSLKRDQINMNLDVEWKF